MILLKCKRCRQSFEIGPDDKRKTGRCFQCGETYTLPMSRNRALGLSTLGFLALLIVLGLLYRFIVSPA